MPALGRVPTDFEEWQEAYQSTPDRDDPFTTVSSEPIRPLYADGGIRGGTVRSDVDVAAIAEQFCAAIIGIVYTWLVSPLAHTEVRRLHAGLKRQLTAMLGPSGAPDHAVRKVGR